MAKAGLAARAENDLYYLRTLAAATNAEKSTISAGRLNAVPTEGGGGLQAAPAN